MIKLIRVLCWVSGVLIKSKVWPFPRLTAEQATHSTQPKFKRKIFVKLVSFLATLVALQCSLHSTALLMLSHWVGGL